MPPPGFKAVRAMIMRRAHRPTSDFTIISNSILRDERLSFRARGVLSYVLSMPDDWRIDSDQLSRGEAAEGRDAIRTAIKELEAVGYIERVKGQDERGRWVTILVVHEVPESAPDGKTAGRTDDWKTDVGKPGAIRRTVTNSSGSRASTTPHGKPAPHGRRQGSRLAAASPPVHDPISDRVQQAIRAEQWRDDAASQEWIRKLTCSIGDGRQFVLEDWLASGRAAA